MSTNLTKYRDTLKSPELLKRFNANDPSEKGLKFQEEIAHAELAARQNPKLMECDPQSIIIAVANVSLTGLSLSKTLNQAYLVPRWNNDRGCMEAILDPGYQGYITKMVDLGVAKQVYAHVVYENDYFDMDLGTNKTLIHKPFYLNTNIDTGKPYTEKGEELGAYAVAVLPDGSTKFEFLHISRINDIASTAKTQFMWKGLHREEMIKKTVVKYLWKYMPKNPTKGIREFAQIVEADNESHFDTEKSDTSSIIDVSTESGETLSIQTKSAIVPDIKIIPDSKEESSFLATNEMKPVKINIDDININAEGIDESKINTLTKFLEHISEQDLTHVSSDGTRNKELCESIKEDLEYLFRITSDNIKEYANKAFGKSGSKVTMEYLCKKAPVEKIKELVLTTLK